MTIYTASKFKCGDYLFIFYLLSLLMMDLDASLKYGGYFSTPSKILA